MRFVLAIVSFVVAAAMIGTGIAQQTFLRPASRVSASVVTDSAAPITIVDGATLNAFPRTQHLSVGGSSEVFAAYGRTDDVLAWVGKASYNSISYDPATKQLASKLVQGTESSVPSPAGSDLWLQSYTDKLSLDLNVQVPSTISFIIVSDGTAPAPPDLTLSWPVDNSTPWVGPLLLGGAIVLLIGLLLLLWAIIHMRRSRGPRRRQPRMPKLPKRPRFKPAAKRRRAIASGGRDGRRSARLSFVVVPATLAVLAGCTTGSGLPTIDSTPAATSTPSAATVKPPAVAEAQGDRIIERISAVAASADKSKKASTLETRFAGPALAARLADYKIRAVNKSQKALDPVPTGGVELLLPQQQVGWPRTVFAVVGDGATQTDSTTQYALTLVQDDPRSNYKVHYLMKLANALPELPVASVGTVQLQPDGAGLLAYDPDTIASSYGSVLLEDKKSKSYTRFDIAKDPIIKELGLAAKKKQQKDLPSTVKLSFSDAVGSEAPIVLASIDGGAIVSVELDEVSTIRPVQSGASISNPKDVKALSGKATTTKGMVVTYVDQLLFYVPSSAAKTPGPMTMLAYATSIKSAVEVKKSVKVKK